MDDKVITKVKSLYWDSKIQSHYMINAHVIWKKDKGS